MAQYIFNRNFDIIKSIPYCLIIASGGGLIGLITCVAGGTHIKWFIVYLLAIFMFVMFAFYKDKRRLALGLFIFFIPFFVGKQIISSEYPIIAGGPSSIGIFLYDVPLMLLFAYMIKEWAFNSGFKIYVPKIVVPFVFYIAWSGVSIINTVEPVLAIFEIVWFCRMVIILIVISNLVKSRSDLIFVFSILIIGLSLQELVTFAQAYFKVWFSFTGDVEHTNLDNVADAGGFRAGGTLGVHNVQSAYYVLLVALTAGIYFITQNRKLKFILLLIIFGGLYSVVITFSRNGYLCLVLALTIVIFFAWRRNLIKKIHYMMGAWLFFIAILIVTFLGGRVIERVQSKAAIDPRTEGVVIALNMIKKHPFAGVGLNNFSLVMHKHDYAPEGISRTQQGYFGGHFFGTVVHNKFLLVASETGIIGLGFFLWMFYLMFSYAIKLTRNRDRFFWGIGAGMVAALTGGAIQRLFSIYSADLLITVFWVLVSLIFAAHKISVDEKIVPDVNY